jgi:predicted Zn-ribbon and HTH transcriptional regulator
MKNKPDAYELFATGAKTDVIKCMDCGFRAVRAQFDEDGGCPSCVNKDKNKKNKGSIEKGKYKGGQ